jgi:hypothetical protein
VIAAIVKLQEFLFEFLALGVSPLVAFSPHLGGKQGAGRRFLYLRFLSFHDDITLAQMLIMEKLFP